jgi:FlaA1/EpsC-like NDP-sugar epimerase
MSKVFRQYHTWRLPVCLCVEFLLLSGVVVLAAALRFRLNGQSFAVGFDYILHAFLTAVVCQLCMYYTDLYELRVALSTSALLGKLGRALGAATAVLMVLFYILPPLAFGRGIFAISLVLAWCGLVGWRLLYQRLHTLSQFRVRVLILGTSDEARQLAAELGNHATLGYELRGFVGDTNEVGKALLP